jgi:hypothetical protein
MGRATISVIILVPLSVCRHWWPHFQLDVFPWNFTLEAFVKICRPGSSLVKMGHNYRTIFLKIYTGKKLFILCRVTYLAQQYERKLSVAFLWQQNVPLPISFKSYSSRMPPIICALRKSKIQTRHNVTYYAYFLSHNKPSRCTPVSFTPS